MDSSILIIVLSLSVLISYAFDLFSSRFKTPSVLLLLLLGMLTRQATAYFDVQVPYVNAILPTLGTLGLILIVLEGGLDIELNADRLSVLRRTLLASLLAIAGGTLLMAGTLYLLLNDSFYHCLIAALPFSIISSTVTVQNVEQLSTDQREYAIHESAFASILGIMGYNFLVLSQGSVLGAVWLFTRDTLVMALISLLCCFLLLYLIGRINHRIKFLPIISVLFLVYALAEINHLSSLLLILIFGLFLNNTELFIRGRLSLILKNDLFEKELDQLKNLTAEGSFVVRTFFYLILVKHPKPGPVLLNHERIHLRQQAELGIVPFYLWYFLEYLIRRLQYRHHYWAYRNISFEREAFANEDNLQYLKSRRWWSFWLYLNQNTR